MYLKYVVFFVFLITSLLFNVQMPTKVIDMIQMITVVGYDATEQDTLRGTVVAPKYLPQGKVEDFIYTDTADTVYENRVKLNAKATERLLSGKLKVVFYNRELAERGIKNFVEFMRRDPSIGGKVYLAVTEGSTLELINSVQTSKGRGMFFTDLFEHNIKHGNLPQTNLKEFESDWQSETTDPILPMFSIENKKPELQSIALFDGDKYVDKLPIKDADVFKLLYENVSDGSFQHKNEKYYISIENVESDKDVAFEAKKESGEVTVNLQVRGVIREFTGRKPTNQLPAIEKDIQKDLTQKSEKLIKRFQELNIDPLGIEGDVKSSNRNYDKQHFKEVYPEMPISVNVDVRLTETGTRR